MKQVGLGIAAIFGVFVLIIGITFAAGGAQWITAPFRGAVDQREQVQADGTYRIAAYDRFYNLCGQIKAKEQQIDNLEAVEMPEGQKQTTLLALQNQRVTLIEQYNADARKTDTRANFLASDLPFTINAAQETTTC